MAHDRERAAAGEHEDRVKRILMFAESITDYFFELDAELRVSGISERFTELTGFEAHEIIGRSVLDPLRHHAGQRAHRRARHLLERVEGTRRHGHGLGPERFGQRVEDTEEERTRAVRLVDRRQRERRSLERLR